MEVTEVYTEVARLLQLPSESLLTMIEHQVKEIDIDTELKIEYIDALKRYLPQYITDNKIDSVISLLSLKLPCPEILPLSTAYVSNELVSISNIVPPNILAIKLLYKIINNNQFSRYGAYNIPPGLVTESRSRYHSRNGLIDNPLEQNPGGPTIYITLNNIFYPFGSSVDSEETLDYFISSPILDATGWTEQYGLDTHVNCGLCDGFDTISCSECEEGLYSCGECDGNPSWDCDTCDAEGEVDCHNCYGTGTMECAECNGTNEEETSCEVCTDSGYLGHLVVDCEDCFGGGVECLQCEDGEKCEYCNGDKIINCPKCSDFGEGPGFILEPCETCEASGTVTKECSETDCNEGQLTCDDCDGSGKESCDDCEGQGTRWCEYCEDGYVTCGECEGDWDFGNCPISTLMTPNSTLVQSGIGGDKLNRLNKIKDDLKNNTLTQFESIFGAGNFTLESASTCLELLNESAIIFIPYRNKITIICSNNLFQEVKLVSIPGNTGGLAQRMAAHEQWINEIPDNVTNDVLTGLICINIPLHLPLSSENGDDFPNQVKFSFNRHFMTADTLETALQSPNIKSSKELIIDWRLGIVQSSRLVTSPYANSRYLPTKSILSDLPQSGFLVYNFASPIRGFNFPKG